MVAIIIYFSKSIWIVENICNVENIIGLHAFAENTDEYILYGYVPVPYRTELAI